MTSKVDQQVQGTHELSPDGNVMGGVTSGTGIAIRWQDGLVPKGESRWGAFVEDVIAAVIDRLQAYQGGPCACVENAQTIHHLQCALETLLTRTAIRKGQGVEGTYAPHRPVVPDDRQPWFGPRGPLTPSHD